jgi:hypothetical protein
MGWGARLLGMQDRRDRWGGGLYTPKWTSTTYTLLLLRDLGLRPGNRNALAGCRLLLDCGLWPDGGINLSATLGRSEACVTGMVMSICASLGCCDLRLDTLLQYLLREQLPDGGWNCEAWRGATHSSFHTTIVVLEGLRDYERLNTPGARVASSAQARGREFLAGHRLYRSHRTGAVVDPAMTRFAFPPRWHYDILRGLDYFRSVRAPRDERLSDAIEVVRKRRRDGGLWILQNRYRGRVFFDMERVGEPSRWNTLRALRVLKWWEEAG